MSASITPAAGASPWRVAVIGVVGLLAAGIGVAAGTFLLTGRDAGIGSMAAYVPADAPFYVELRLDPSASQDGALRELLGHFPPIEGVDLAQPLYGQLTRRFDELLTEEQTDASWAEDVAPWFDGQLAMALTELPAGAMQVPADPMAEPEIPSFLVLLGVTDPAAAEASIGPLLAEAGEEPVTFTETEHAGVTIHVPEGAEVGAWALAGDQLLIGPDADTIAAAIDAEAAGSGTLAEVADMSRLTDALPSDWLLFMTFDMTDVMAEAFVAAESQAPGMADAFRSLLEHQPMRGAMAISAAGERVLLDGATDPPTGPFAVANAERGLASEVPADALYYSEAGNLGAAFVGVLGPLKAAAAATPDGAQQLDTIEAALGADLEELVSWIGDGAITIGWDGRQPYGGLVLVPTDVEAAGRRLAQLASFASLAAADPSSGISVAEAELAGVTITTITWQGPDGGGPMPTPTGLAVEYALTDDRALIGIGEGFVARALELDETASLAAVPRFTDAIAELGGPENTGVAWLDLAAAREAIESALGPMIEIGDPGGVYADEVRPWLVPLDRFVTVSRLEGDVLLQRAVLIVD